MPYPNNAEHLTRGQEVSILKSFGLTQPGLKTGEVQIQTRDLRITRSSRGGGGHSTHLATPAGLNKVMKHTATCNTVLRFNKVSHEFSESSLMAYVILM